MSESPRFPGVPAAARAEAALALAPALYRVARRLTRRPDDASAVTLDAVAAVLSGASAPVRTLGFRALWDAVTRRAEAPAALPCDTPPASAEQLLEERLGCDEGELDRLLISRLDASPEVDLALRQLPEHERFLLLLIDAEEASREEVAEALHCAPAAVARHLLVARARMFASLADFARRAPETIRTDKGEARHPSLGTLQDVLDLTLAGPDRLAVDEHLATCGACRRSLHALRWTKVRLAGVGHGSHLPAPVDAEIRRMVAAAVPATRAPARDAPTAAHHPDTPSRQWFEWWRKSPTSSRRTPS